jgi:thioredoxin-related protein
MTPSNGYLGEFLVNNFYMHFIFSLIIFYSISLTNYIDFDPLIRKAKKENKLIVLIFSADWCQNGNKVLNDLNTTQHDKFYIDKYALYKYINIDKMENKEILNRFNISIIPSVVFYHPKLRYYETENGSVSVKYLNRKIKIIKNKIGI